MFAQWLLKLFFTHYPDGTSTRLSLSLSCYISETDKTFQFDRNNLSVRECWLSALLYREVIPPHLNINYVLLVSVNTGRLMAEGGGENGATVR